MKLKDVIWIAVVLALIAIMVVPSVSTGYLWLNTNLPYVAGFLKFAILATMGDMLAIRLRRKCWAPIKGLGWRALVYGFIGMLMTIVFQLFSGGTVFAMTNGFLPLAGNKFFTAFFTSLLMNCLFAPTFMAFHRITDTLIDMRYEQSARPRLKDALNRIDFADFVSFVVCKTVPIFWVPMHTVTFLLPNEYRVLFAAILSIAMGAILSFAKGRSQAKKAEA